MYLSKMFGDFRDSNAATRGKQVQGPKTTARESAPNAPGGTTTSYLEKQAIKDKKKLQVPAIVSGVENYRQGFRFQYFEIDLLS